MRTFDLRNDIEQVALQLVRAVPEIFMDFDLSKVQLVRTEDFGIYDVVVIEDDQVEVVVGEVIIMDDLTMTFEAFSEEMEAGGAILDY